MITFPPDNAARFSYQIGEQGHRGTRAIQRLVEFAPASGGLALWMQHRDVETVPASVCFADYDNRYSHKPWIIGNDGSTLFYGPQFQKYSLEEQTGMVAHQVLHVALRHVDREIQLRERYGQIDAELFALCADAIVNASLSHLTWLMLPKGSVFLDKLLQDVLGIEQTPDVSLHKWDTESLYRAIDDRQTSGGGNARQGHGRGKAGDNSENSPNSARGKASLNNSTEDNTSQSTRKDNLTSNTQAAKSDANNKPSGSPQTAVQFQTADQLVEFKDGPKSLAARQLAGTIIRDLIPSPSTSPETRLEQSMQWSERLLSAHAADADQSFMRQLLADNLRSKTPWEQVLRTRMQHALSLHCDVNWSRPTRSWLANRGRTSSGHRLPWQPGTSCSRTSPRLCILVDVSGSIEDALLQRFSNEIDRIVRTFNTETLLLIGDDRVRERHRLKSGVAQLRAVQFSGGGGTDFVPMIEAAGEFKPDIGVFLSDLEGPAGDAPAWPIVWAVPIEANAQPVPYGQRILLD